VIAILDYGMGNLRSVAKAVERVGGRPEIVSSPAEAMGADALVVPGVGAFGACMAGLRATGLDGAIAAFARAGRPVFGVCLGMQVLFDGSEEGSGEGLRLIPGVVKRLAGPVKVPHMGWNNVEWTADHPYTGGVPSGAWFYFVHSFAVEARPRDTVGVTEYGYRFSAAVAAGSVFATQFHPEKSGQAGLALYEAFVKEVG
jgi:glutamine amidotransferase